MIKDFSSIKEVVDEVVQDDDARTIMVIGGSDTGKTTVVKELSRSCALKEKTAVVDVDPGQSNIGPPTTVAWAKIEEKFDNCDQLKAQHFYFVGDTSPRGNLLPLTVGARVMWNRAHSVCHRIVVDTTGLVKGGIGKVLKLHLIDLLSPELIVAIYKKDELEHILTPLSKVKTPTVFKMPASGKVSSKNFSERRLHRELKFKQYFREAREIEFSKKDVGLNISGKKLNSLVVSLRDEKNKDCALGIIKGEDKRRTVITIYSPLSNPERVKRVVPGKIKLTREGVQITTHRFR